MKYEKMTAREEAIDRLQEAIDAVENELKTNSEKWNENDVPKELSDACLEELNKLLRLAKANKPLKDLVQGNDISHELAGHPHTQNSPVLVKVMKAIQSCRWVKDSK